VIVWDAIATIICGLAGGIITPVLYAVHGPYKASGARINYTWWSAAAFFVMVVTGLSSFVGQLFPWPILAALIAYVAVGVGLAELRSTPSRHHGALLLAFILPGAAVVASAVSSTVTALGVSATDPKVIDALDTSVHWRSLQALANGFLLLVLVISAVLVEMVDRRFTFASVRCLIAAGLSWIGLLHGSRLGWGVGPQATLGWLIAAVVMYSARWWSAEVASPDRP
jgi:AGZA family xanthine/uracil permease-like MFS transporter